MKTMLSQLLARHLEKLGLPVPEEIVLDEPKVKDHGDLSSNLAMVLAKTAKRKPQELAAALAQSLASESVFIEKVEVKGPGFLNFFLKPSAYQEALKSLWAD